MIDTFDLSPYTSLTRKHLPQIEEKAHNFSSLFESVLEGIIKNNRPYMYIDDYPGLRGDAQLNVAAAKYALELKKR